MCLVSVFWSSYLVRIHRISVKIELSYVSLETLTISPHGRTLELAHQAPANTGPDLRVHSLISVVPSLPLSGLIFHERSDCWGQCVALYYVDSVFLFKTMLAFNSK